MFETTVYGKPYELFKQLHPISRQLPPYQKHKRHQRSSSIRSKAFSLLTSNLCETSNPKYKSTLIINKFSYDPDNTKKVLA